MNIQLSEDLTFSRLVHGHWRMADWNMSSQQILQLTQQIMEMGITTFDHADIYGDYTCERLFGDALVLDKSIRKDIQIVSKCGIKLVSKKFPERSIKTYDYSFNYIIGCVEQSLLNFRTDYIDVLLLHRPAPFFNPEELAKAFAHLKQSGMVRYFGVSNFLPHQFELLDSYTDEQLVTNQIEISPLCLEHFDNGNIDFCLKEKIKPMAWSPVGGGQLFDLKNEKSKKLLSTLKTVAEELDVDQIDQVVYSWLLKHPTQIIPVLGSGKLERIQSAVKAIKLEMSLEQWYKIYIAASGKELP